VFVSGGSGFVGTAVIEELLSRGHSVNALVHRGNLRVTVGDVRVVRGDLFDRAALDECLRGCDAVVHLVGIIMERPSRGVTFERIHFKGTRNVVDAAKRNDVRRYVHMSALGTRPDAVSNYHKTKYRAEQYVRSSGLDWTILRPSLIHGPAGEFMRMEANWARHKAPPFLFMPYFGGGLLGRGGAGMLQPVYVNDVARAFVDALDNPKTVGEVYPPRRPAAAYMARAAPRVVQCHRRQAPRHRRGARLVREVPDPRRPPDASPVQPRPSHHEPGGRDLRHDQVRGRFRLGAAAVYRDTQ
jgi:NADH dehydrogenase